jgi:hypothetical protein
MGLWGAGSGGGGAPLGSGDAVNAQTVSEDPGRISQVWKNEQSAQEASLMGSILLSNTTPTSGLKTWFKKRLGFQSRPAANA